MSWPPRATLVSTSQVIDVQDEEHALRVLRDMRPDLGVAERHDLARRLANGSALLVIDDEWEQLDPAPSSSDEIDPLVPDMPEPPEPTPEALTFVELRLRTVDGVILPDVSIAFDLSDGRGVEANTDAGGVIRFDDVAADGLCRARLVQRVELPPPTGNPGVLGATREGVYLVMAASQQSELEFSSGKVVTVAIERPGTHIVELEDLNFAWNRHILLPDFGDIDENAGLPVTARAVLRTVLRFAEAHPHKRILVAGHTDTHGSAGNNMKVSERRARNVYLYLRGDRAAWAADCQQHHEVADWQAILLWVAQTFGWDTNPGPIDNDYGSGCAGARRRFRETYNAVFTDASPVSVDGPQSDQDWAAFFDLYDLALSRVMHIDLEKFSALRASLQFVGEGTLACGEHQPKEAIGRDGFLCRSNRRVDILFFEADDLPNLDAQPPGAGVYQAGYTVVPLDVPGVGSLTFRVVDEAGDPVAGAEVTLLSPYGDQLVERTDAAGCVPIPALWGDEFEVVAVNAGGAARLVDITRGTTA